jgi:hypothetical protein
MDVREWDITLSPFSATFSRDITFPFLIGNGLGVIDNTTLIVVNNVPPQSIYEMDITTTSAVGTYKFDLPPTHQVAGDILLTTTNKLLVTTASSPNSYLLQYDYLTGNLELTITLNPTVAEGPWGIFENSGNIYVAGSLGGIYSIDTTSPYNITLVNNVGNQIYGASQIPSCLTNDFIIPTCRCYSITNTNIYNTLSFRYYDCDGVLINETIPPNSSRKFCGNGVTSVGQGTLVGDCDVSCKGAYPNT